MNIYLAGKIRKNCWRHSLVDNLRSGPSVDGFYGYQDITKIHWPVMERAIFHKFDYTGPYFVGCDHGCFHAAASHGWGEQGFCASPTTDEVRNVVYKLCKKAIESSDILFAWIDSNDAYGTIAEVAYAHALGKKVAIAFSQEFPEMWFISKMGISRTYTDAQPGEAFKDLMQELGVLEKDSPGFVYLMHATGTSRYKIGRSYDPTKREYQLNTTKSPFDVELLKSIKTQHDKKAEMLLHEYFRDKRTRGEWFELEPFDLHLVMSLTEEILNHCISDPNALSAFSKRLKNA